MFMKHKVIIENLSSQNKIPQPNRTDYHVHLENFTGIYKVNWFMKSSRVDSLIYIKTDPRFTYFLGDRENLNANFEKRQLFIQLEADTLQSELIFICHFQFLMALTKKQTLTQPKFEKK